MLSLQILLCPRAGRHFFCLETKETKIQEEIMLQPALGNAKKKLTTRMQGTLWFFLTLAHYSPFYYF